MHSNKKIFTLAYIFLSLFIIGCSNQSNKSSKYDKQYTEYSQKYKKTKYQNDKIRNNISKHKEKITQLNDSKEEYQNKIKHHIPE